MWRISFCCNPGNVNQQQRQQQLTIVFSARTTLPRSTRCCLLVLTPPIFIRLHIELQRLLFLFLWSVEDAFSTVCLTAKYPACGTRTSCHDACSRLFSPSECSAYIFQLIRFSSAWIEISFSHFVVEVQWSFSNISVDFQASRKYTSLVCRCQRHYFY